MQSGREDRKRFGVARAAEEGGQRTGHLNAPRKPIQQKLASHLSCVRALHDKHLGCFNQERKLHGMLSSHATSSCGGGSSTYCKPIRLNVSIAMRVACDEPLIEGDPLHAESGMS